MLDTLIETPEEIAVNVWYNKMLDQHESRFEASKSTYDCMKLGEFKIHKFDLCEAFKAGYQAALHQS